MYCSKCGAVIGEGIAFCQTCGTPTGSKGATPGVVPESGTTARPLYGGFWLRFVASLIDGLIVGIPMGAIIVAVMLAAGLSGAMGRIGEGNGLDILPFLFGGAFLTIFLVAFVGGWLYFAFCESSAWQATLGKKALSLAVTDLAGNRVSFGRATGRHFGKLLSGHPTLFIGYILAGLTAKKQALHDMIASCLVVRRP